MQTYRLNAEKCLVLARTFNDRERRLALLGMANAWLTLAEQHLRNTGLRDSHTAQRAATAAGSAAKAAAD